jgi:hypothetical protein
MEDHKASQPSTEKNRIRSIMSTAKGQRFSGKEEQQLVKLPSATLDNQPPQ